MYYSDKVILIQKKSEADAKGVPVLDDIGNPIYKEEKTEVWADVRSPSRSETAAAGAQGLKPEYTVVVHVSDYDGQTKAIVNGRLLAVYRTYVSGEDIELHVTEKRGETDGN